jgi:hypothetical protein
MCRPIRSLTEAKGHALSKHVYDVFATYDPSLLLIAFLSLSVLQVLAEVGGQCHRVDLIDCLGIIINSRGTTRNRDCSVAEYRQDPHSPAQLNSLRLRPSTRRSVRRSSFAHTLPSTLWHLTLASTRCSSAYEVQEPSAETLSSSALPKLKSRLDKLSADVKAQLIEQGFNEDRIKFERKLNMRFDGTDTAIMVLEKEGQGESSFEEEFKKQYKAEFGFLLEEKNIVVDDVKVCTRLIH